MTQPERAHSRFDIDLAAEIVNGERSFTAKTRNISEGGCCIESSYPLEEGAGISLSLFLVVDGVEEPDFPPLETQATVQWTAENQKNEQAGSHIAGLKFNNITEAQVTWLRSQISD